MEKSGRYSSMWVFLVMVVVAGLYMGPAMAVNFNYGDALQKSILYFEGQRSGKLPVNQRVRWRGDSGLADGRDNGVDLTGGYYDAGDNVKFGLPMAFTVTMLSWSAIEYGNQAKSSNQLGYLHDAIKWGTDYFIKAHPQPNVLYGEVGDGDSDHACWMRPEQMTTSRLAYVLNPTNPGSDLAGETAAAMAAASLVFRGVDARYADILLVHARQLFTFADTYRGKYDSSIRVAQKYYASASGYYDELLWAAIWLYEASGDQTYLNYLATNANQFGGTGWAMDQFSWDNKYAGVQLKATKLLLDGKAGPYTQTFQSYQAKAEYFLCAAVGKNNGKQIARSPGGMFWTFYWNNMQYVTTAAFLLTVGHDYYTASRRTLTHCSSPVDNSLLLTTAKSQVDYILGNNNRGASYLVGFGQNFPQHVHHRASSIISMQMSPQFVSCNAGYSTWYGSSNANPNVLFGALVGGPDQNDNFLDDRSNYAMTEPATYNTAPLVGVLARFQSIGSVLSSQPDPSTKTGLPTTHHMQQHPQTHQSRQFHRPLPGTGNRPVVSSASSIVITQSLLQRWTVDGKHYFKFGGRVTNNSKRTINSLTVVVHRLFGPMWGLGPKHRNGNLYTFPQWAKSLTPMDCIEFAYIHEAPGQAEIYVRHYTFA